MQTQAKWISPPFSCWKCPLFVLLFFFYKKELTGLHFSVTDRKYSSISLKFQKYFFTQFSDFPNYWPRPGWPATAKKENLSNFAKKMFCRSGICSRQRFIHFICHLQSSRCNNTMNKLKMFVHQTKIFWENFNVFDCRWGGGINHQTGLGNFIMLWAPLEAWRRWKHSQSFYIKLQIIQNALK